MSRFKSVVALVMLAAVVLSITVYSQPPGRRGRRGGGEQSLSEPFRGVVAGGKIEKGLFKIESTGVSTEPIVMAAGEFLDGLSEQQRERTLFPVDDLEWRKWDNRHFYKRQGVGFDEMNEEQQNSRLH